MRIQITLKQLKPMTLAQLVGTLILSASGFAHAAVPNTFSAGTTISASQMNANFATVESQIAAPNVTGNITMVPATGATAGVIMKDTAGVLAPFLHDYGGNTFLGTSAGNFTMTGFNNAGLGAYTLSGNTTGGWNTAIGAMALQFNTTGFSNNAVGYGALNANTTGSGNTADGLTTLFSNTTGFNNTAVGGSALYVNTTGSFNTAIGNGALGNGNTTGTHNTAVGISALLFSTGNYNIALGAGAGNALTTGSNNIDIGHSGVAGESGVIRIGAAVGQTATYITGIRGVTTANANAIAVVVDSAGQLGTVSSSRRFKDDIADMSAASDVLMKLRPVTFHYKSDKNPNERTLQYGLIAEEVAQVAPQLVARSADGQIETVYYQHLAPMLLNEYQKQQRIVRAQAAELKLQSAQLTKQTERIAALEKLGQELVALKREFSRMSAVVARLDGAEKVASADR